MWAIAQFLIFSCFTAHKTVWENKEHANMCSESKFSSTQEVEREHKFPSLFLQSLPFLQNIGK